MLVNIEVPATPATVSVPWSVEVEVVVQPAFVKAANVILAVEVVKLSKASNS